MKSGNLAHQARRRARRALPTAAPGTASKLRALSGDDRVAAVPGDPPPGHTWSCRLRQLSHRLRGYGLAIFAVIAATLVRWALDPHMGDYAPYPTYLAMVAFVGLYAGRGPALVAMAGGGVLADLLFVSPRGELAILHLDQGLGLALFCGASLVMIAITERLRTGTARLEESKRRAEALRELAQRREQEFKTLAENSPDLIVRLDRQLRNVYVNPALEAVVGVPAATLIGKTYGEAGFGGEAVERWEQQVSEVFATGKERECEFRWGGPNGTRYYTARLVPEFDDNGVVATVLSASRDISERKIMEDSLRDNDRRKDQFLAMLAHELRNPLATIGNAIHLLHVADPPDENAAWAAAAVERQTRHLAHLIDDLLDVARISTGQIQLHPTRLDLVGVVHDAAHDWQGRFAVQELSFDVSVPARPIEIEADGSRIRQVLDNLLDNAAKYTEPGGRIALTACPAGDSVEIRVTDTGVGLAPEEASRVFDLFEQVNPGIARSKGGLGLGLNLVRRLVEMHGGSVEARSEGAGHGTEFIVRLPLHGPRSAAATGERRVRDRRSQKGVGDKRF